MEFKLQVEKKKSGILVCIQIAQQNSHSCTKQHLNQQEEALLSEEVLISKQYS